MAKFERLTYRDKNGEVLLDSTNTDIDRAVYRLSAYEDTGLSPEEVKRRAWVRVEDGLPPKQNRQTVKGVQHLTRCDHDVFVRHHRSCRNNSDSIQR